MLDISNIINAELQGFPGTMSIYADNLHGNLITKNVNEIYECGSCIKVFILAVLLEHVEIKSIPLNTYLIYSEEDFVEGSGILRYSKPGTSFHLEDLCTWSIIISDNIATNILISYLGLNYINQRIQAFGFKNTKLLNKIKFNKPRFNSIGYTTVYDYAMLFSKLLQKTFISPKISNKMIDILSKQQNNTMLTKYLPTSLLPPNIYNNNQIIVASKSGSMDNCRNDGGIIFSPNCNYIICIFTKNFSDYSEYTEHPSFIYGGRISKTIFDYYITLSL